MVEKIAVTDVFGKKEFEACEEHNRRLGRLEVNLAAMTGTKRADKFKKPGQWTKWYIEADTVYSNNSRDQVIYDRLRKDLCVIIPCHRYQRPWMKACLEGVKKLDYFSILAYDNPYHLGQVKSPIDTLLPPNDIMALANYISIKPPTYHSGVTAPHMWNMIFAVNQAFALGFEYIFCINGDFIMERPENFQQLRDMMGDADIFPLAWNPRKPSCGTAAFIAKAEHQVKFWREFANTLHQPKGNAEARLGRYYVKNKLKVFHNYPGPMSHQMPNKKSDWYNIVGLRHLHAENKKRRWESKLPIEREYFDERFMTPNERKCLTAYWDTGDEEHLKKWWGEKK
jgi:hypothetical protein